MTVTEGFIVSQAPNASAVENGRKLSRGGKFFGHAKTADDTAYWAQCSGSGKTPYRVSIDWSDPGAPVCRCSCPSRQFPCKHAVGLMFECLAEKEFTIAPLPDDLLEKREKKAARAEKKTSAAESKPKKTSNAAKKKKLARQLEGLEKAEQITEDLLRSGLGTLTGTSAHSLEQVAKELGNCYLTGPQTAFSRIALMARTVQKDSACAAEIYSEALNVLLALHTVLKKARPFLEETMGDAGSGDAALFEALGGIWRLEDLHAIGAYRENVRLMQLAFDVSYDAAKKETVRRGWWIDLDTGRIDYTLNLVPVKAQRHVKAEDSCFDLLEVPVLYTYPGKGSCRIRWENSELRAPALSDFAVLPALAQNDIAAAVRAAKEQMKNPLLPKSYPALLPVGQIGKIGETFVLEDKAGGRIILKDCTENSALERLSMLPAAVDERCAVFGMMFYEESERRIYLNPCSVVTPSCIYRLNY